MASASSSGSLWSSSRQRQAPVFAVLWPRSWEFAVGPQEVIRTYIEADRPAPLSEVYEEISLHLGTSLLHNKQGLELLGALLQIAGLLLSLDVVLWIVAVAVGA